MIPKAGQFFASRADTFIGKSIREAETIQEKRIRNYHNQMLWNHVGCFIEVDGILMVCESLAEGFVIYPWKDSEYEQRKKEFIILELYNHFNEQEVFAFTKIIKSFEGIPYDFEGIVDQIDFVLTGKWKGEKGINARARMYCSEAIATAINDIKKGIFPFPWFVNPQMFVENACIVILKNQYYYEK